MQVMFKIGPGNRNAQLHITSSKRHAIKERCIVVHKARCAFPLDVVRVNHFRIHNLRSLVTYLHALLSLRFSYLRANPVTYSLDIFFIDDAIFHQFLYVGDHYLCQYSTRAFFVGCISFCYCSVDRGLK